MPVIGGSRVNIRVFIHATKEVPNPGQTASILCPTSSTTSARRMCPRFQADLRLLKSTWSELNHSTIFSTVTMAITVLVCDDRLEEGFRGGGGGVSLP